MRKLLFALFLLFSASAHAQASYFARVENGIVAEVLAASQEVIDTRPGVWIRTWIDANGDPAKGYKYAGRGDTYEADRRAFIAPRPYPSWLLNAQTLEWYPPVPYPGGPGNYRWNESTTSWGLP